MQTREQRNAKKKKEQPFFAPAEHEPLLTEVRGFVTAMGRRNTKDAFELGFQLSRVKAVLAEKSFGKWVKQECGFATRHAWNFVAIHEKLGDYQERLVANAVSPTMMAVLASAEPAKIDEVLVTIESGQRLTVPQVKTMVKGDAAKKEKTEAGGAKGLLRAAEAKMKAELELFNKLVKATLKIVEQAASDIGKGKQVTKTKLAEKVEANCQKASDLLRSAISPVQSASAETVEWEKARRVITRLGDSPRWPGRSEFPAWLVGQALPALRFAVLGTPLSGAGNNASDLAAEADEQAVDGEGENLPDEATLQALADVVGAAAATRQHLASAPPLVPAEAVDAAAVDEGVETA